MKNKAKIVIVGSSNMDYTIYVDRFPLPSETIAGVNRYIQPGGKGANQAAAVAKSSLVETHFITCLGNDNDGISIKKTLLDLGIKLHANICNTCTGNATIMVAKNSENNIVIIAGANNKFKKQHIILNVLKGASYVILQNEIPNEINEYVIKKCFELGVKVIYNPAPVRAFDLNLLKYIDTLIVNEIELTQYAKTNVIENGAKKLLHYGANKVLVTLGKCGSICYSENNKIIVKAKKVKAIDTVAAGDTYVGYFASALAINNDINLSMNIASKASAITVSRKGSIISIPSLKELSINF